MNREMLQGDKSRLGESPSLPVKKNKHCKYVGVRKVWGSRKKVSVEDVKEHGERVAVVHQTARIYSLTLSTQVHLQRTKQCTPHSMSHAPMCMLGGHI